MIIISKTVTWLALKWMQSRIRKKFLMLRHRFTVGWRNKKPVAEVYLALNDPYSYMLVQVLPEIATRFNIKFRLLLIHDNLTGMAENTLLWRSWVLKDANKIAEQYKLKKISSMPALKSVVSGQQLWQLKPKTIDNALTLFEQVWHNSLDSHYPSSTPVITHQIKNKERQLSKGHYMPASIYFIGEWYWGIDRLDHFENALIEHGLTYKKTEAKYVVNNLSFALPETTTDSMDALEVFVSIRSPYSYLGFKQAQKISKFYGVPLVIKPVLPMLMRGLELPEIKRWNIFTDSVREAESHNIPFNSFADPLGKGVMDSYRLFSYAASKQLAEQYLSAIFDAIYVNGIDISIENNLIKLCDEIGLDYAAAIAYDTEHDWQTWVDQHQHELESMGFWGVPCFRYGDVETWGQDKLWQIEQAIIR